MWFALSENATRRSQEPLWFQSAPVSYTHLDVYKRQPKEYYGKVIPLGRLGETEDIANMVLYLASEKAGFMTGQIIEVNGGDIMG